jgi:hypothetical protein
MRRVRPRIRLRFTTANILVIVTCCGCLFSLILPKLSQRHTVIMELEQCDGVLIGKSKRNRFWSHVLAIRSFDEVDGLIFRTRTVPTGLIVRLQHLNELSTVVFAGTVFTERDIRAVSELTSLRRLSLIGCNISDADLVHLKSMRSLESIGLSGTDVSDSGLRVLAGMKTLKEVELYPMEGNGGRRGPYVTSEGIRKLRRIRPDLAVHYDDW